MKRIGLLAVALASITGVNAARLTPDQALQRITGHPVGRGIPSNVNYKLSYTEKSMGEDRLYVFNKGDRGFVVTSADDRLPALLGYSDEGAFDIEKVAPALKWWLSQYADEASYFLNNEDKYTRSARTRAERSEIPTLLTTKWNQGEPYNLDCPEDNGGRCVTGCVATAMAQVINYHKYPVTGTGTHAYDWYGKTLEFDYGAATFDYANMLDEYNPYEDTATDAQKAAVAKLMYACGVGVDMDYTSDMSGAYDLLVVNALQTYFNYSSSVRYLLRTHYTTQEWEDIIYAELEADRPVIYSGQAPTGGHEFVCDGYRDNFFHINWGWGGYGDGYFPLSGLDPNYEGIGGFEGGYNSDQNIICGITPDNGISAPQYAIYSTGGISVTNVQLNRYASIRISNGFIGNYGVDPVTLDFYLKVVSENGQEYMVEEGHPLEFTSAAETGNVSGYSGFGIYFPAELPTGDYKAYLVFKTPEGDYQDISFPITASSYLNMTVDETGNVTFTSGAPKEKAKIQVTDFAPVSTIVSGEKTTFNFTARNNGEVEYDGAIYIRVFIHGTTDEIDTKGINFSLNAGGEFNGQVGLTYELEDGEYDAIFFDMYDDQISDIFPLMIGIAPVLPSGIVLNIAEATMFVDDILQLSATIEPENADDKAVVWTTSDAEVANVDENGLVTAFTVGTVTITATSAVSDEISATCEITVEAKVIEVDEVSLDVTEATLTEGEVLTLAATVSPDDASDKEIVWSSSDEEVATVEDGVVTAVGPGVAVIKAEASNGKSATCEITVEAKVIEVDEVSLDVTEATLTEGEVLTLTATVSPDDASDKEIVWSSSDEEVATVEDGVVTAVSPGVAVIKAEASNGKSATCEITVEAKVIEVDEVSLDVTEATLTEGEALTLAATVSPDDASDKEIVWSSSDEEVAIVEDGVVTAVSPGVAVIKAEASNGKSATCEITVEAKAPEIVLATSIELDRTVIEAIVGDVVKLTATVLPDDTTDKTVVWTSSNDAVATVDEEGNVTIVSIGSAVITATTTDGTNLEAKCDISGLSGIEAIICEAGTADIYTLNGMLIKKNVDYTFLSHLAKGTYLVNVNGKVYKIVK